MLNSSLLSRVRKAREKSAGVTSEFLGSLPGGSVLAPDNINHPFGRAVQQAAESQLRSDAMTDVTRMGLTSLGVGAGAAGLAGLVRSIKKSMRKPQRTSGPEILPLPYPVEEDELPNNVARRKSAAITGKAGIPWYGPAMLFGGMAGLGAGWKGVDSVLKQRAKRERDDELSNARQEFHDALMAQYDRPVKATPKVGADGEDCPHCHAVLERGDDGTCNTCGKPWPEKSASMTKSAELGQALDRLYDLMEKAAATWGDIGGAALGGYGMYAGLSGLLTGALVYDKMKKRSNKAILEKALQRRERRKFMQSPTEIYATPEPTDPHTSGAFTRSDARALKTTPGDSAFAGG